MATFSPAKTLRPCGFEVMARATATRGTIVINGLLTVPAHIFILPQQHRLHEATTLTNAMQCDRATGQITSADGTRREVSSSDDVFNGVADAGDAVAAVGATRR